MHTFISGSVFRTRCASLLTLLATNPGAARIRSATASVVGGSRISGTAAARTRWCRIRRGRIVVLSHLGIAIVPSGVASGGPCLRRVTSVIAWRRITWLHGTRSRIRISIPCPLWSTVVVGIAGTWSAHARIVSRRVSVVLTRTGVFIIARAIIVRISWSGFRLAASRSIVVVAARIALGIVAARRVDVVAARIALGIVAARRIVVVAGRIALGIVAARSIVVITTRIALGIVTTRRIVFVAAWIALGVIPFGSHYI